MTSAAKRTPSPSAEVGSTLIALIVALAVCGGVVALIVTTNGKPWTTRVRVAHSVPQHSPEVPNASELSAPSSPPGAGIPVPASNLVTPKPLEAVPQTKTQTQTPTPPAVDKPAVSGKVPLPDISKVAQSPALWPKALTLTTAITVPIQANGRTVGQAQAPAGTVVQLVRVSDPQLEIEYLNQRIKIPFGSTDLLQRAAILARAPIAEPAGAPPQSATASTTTRPAALPSSHSSPPAAVPQGSDHYRAMALEVMEDIQEKYWQRETGRYSKTPDNRSPEYVWGAGVMFSAVVAAA